MFNKSVVCLVLISFTCMACEAGLLGGLSMPPDLAFLFHDEGNQTIGALYNYNASDSTFRSLGRFPSQGFFPGMPRRTSASAYVLTGNDEEYVTTFFKNKAVYFSNGTNGALVRSVFNVSMLFTNGPWRVDAAFSRLNGDRQVIGTSFILRRWLYECGGFGSSCLKSYIGQFAQFSNRFHRNGRVLAALGLSDGKVALFKRSLYAIVHEKGEQAEERPMLA